MSATGVTVMVRLSVSVRAPSDVAIWNDAVPLKSAVGAYDSVANAVLICAAVPDNVIVPVPAPETVAPPVTPRFSAPLVIVTVVVRLALSTSATDTPVIASVPSSATGPSAAGTVFTGASLTGVTVSVTVAVLLSPSMSV